MSKSRAVVAIDYSISCPAITVYPIDRQQFSFENCQHFFLCDKKSRIEKSRSLSNVFGGLHQEYFSDEQRFNNLAWWVMGCISNYSVDVVAIEDYAFGAKGMVFKIGENTGQLKHQLWTHKTPYNLHSPTTIKKFATGKGNAKKEQMLEAFVRDTNIDLADILGTKDIADNSPTSDIIDAFYLCKMQVASLGYK